MVGVMLATSWLVVFVPKKVRISYTRRHIIYVSLSPEQGLILMGGLGHLEQRTMVLQAKGN